MSVSGISSVNFYDLADRYAVSRARSYSNYRTATPSVRQTQADTYVSQQGNTCTDGKDDGKVGFFSALGNIVEGAAKGVVNGIKGMFTDSEGNFSLLQTAKTVALGAACIAFPAAGLVACGIGAVSGGAKLVKGVSTALGAKTDAEAKDAWEAVGDGGLTVAVSALGAKASYKGVVKGASMTSKGSAIKALDKNASLLQKAGALLKDMGRSTKNSVNTLKNTVKILKARKTMSNLEKNLAETTPSEQSEVIKNLKDTQKKIKGIQKNDPGAKDLANKIQEIPGKIKNARESAKAARANLKAEKANLSEAQKALDTVQKSNYQPAIDAAKAHLQDVQNAVKAAKADVGFGKLTSRLSNTNTGKYLSNLTKDGIGQIEKNIKASKDSGLISSLSKDAQAVIKYLQSDKCTYYDAVRQFGYENVLEALEAFAGTRLTDQTV